MGAALFTIKYGKELAVPAPFLCEASVTYPTDPTAANLYIRSINEQGDKP
jgi:hypothetical protein